MRYTYAKLLPQTIFLVCLVLGTFTAFADSSATRSYTDKENSAAYNPAQKYEGEYIQERLYYRNPGSTIWRRMSLSNNYRDVVTCQTALDSLNTTGVWQGHLAQDGSCGPQDEPSYFSLGNRINFDMLMDQGH